MKSLVVLITLTSWNGALCNEFSIGEGLYYAANNVTNEANIAFDIRDILISSQSNSSGLPSPSDIYSNSVYSNTSLKSMSVDNDKMRGDPMFTFYQYAIGNGDYADELVTEYLNEESVGWTQVATDGMIFLNLWMYISHMLYASVDSCRDLDKENSILFIDKAAAYYIGAEQSRGVDSHLTGYSLYARTHLIAMSVGTISEETGEAWVNTNVVLKLIPEALQKISQSGCANTDSFKSLQFTVDGIIRQMTIPLVQNLIQKINSHNVPQIKLYATAVLPQIAACDLQRYEFLKTHLIDDYVESRKNDIFVNLQASYSCMGISCDNVGYLNSNCVDPVGNVPLAGYLPSDDIHEIAKFDLDLLQIEILTEMEAFRAAENLYVVGRNSKAEGSEHGYQTLKDLATHVDRHHVPANQNFENYYQDGNYADTIIMKVFRGQLGSINPLQMAVIAKGTIQTIVLHIAALQEMYKAVNKCEDGQYSDGIVAWDKSAALLIGSSQTKSSGHGHFLFSLANQFCEDFKSCVPLAGEAKVNAELLPLLREGQKSLGDGNCYDVRRNIEDIEPLMLVPFIQGALSSAIKNDSLESNGGEKSIAEGFVYARALNPYLAIAYLGADSILNDNLVLPLQNTTLKPVINGPEIVERALTDSVSRMIVDCTRVGHMNINATYYDVCQTNTILAGGLYVANSDVSEWAQIALDIRDMANEIVQNGDPNEAKQIYLHGRNALAHNGKLKTLAELSTKAGERMKNESTFTLYLYALGYSGFGHSTVSSYLAEEFKSTFASEAAVVLNIWIYITHLLHNAAMDCRSPVTNVARNLFNNARGERAIDEAASLWIGSEQEAGSSSKGWLMYQLTERMAAKFGTKEYSQARVNTEVLKLLRSAKSKFSLYGSCEQGSNTYRQVRVIADKLVVQMTIPLIQSLIYYMSIDDKERIKIYAKAALPRIVGCNMALYQYLEEILVNGAYESKMFPSILQSLQSSYSCLGITCGDIGSFDRETSSCTDADVYAPLASYVPTTDVREHAKIDLDILQVFIFTMMGADETAKDLYSIGHNSKKGDTFRSLKDLATNNNREKVPQFHLFSQYFGDKNFAHNLVMKALNHEEPFHETPRSQRVIIVHRALQFMIMYMYALREMYDAVSDCEAGDLLRNVDQVKAWDEAAAFLIGSIDSNQGDNGDPNGSGQLLFSLAKERCPEFGTCSDDFAKVNDELLSLLKTGQAQLVGNKCSSLRDLVGDIETLLAVPLIQSMLYHAVQSNSENAGSTSGSIAEAFMFANAILPLIDHADSDAGEAISYNLVHPFTTSTKPVPDGYDSVFGNAKSAFPGMNIDCEDIGTYGGWNFCDTSSSSRGASVRSSCTALSLIGLVTTTYIILLH
mmetsp:Transcript_64/g.114  ORF Transcript_64/g.114 Transcript_64/m.114 type:complete len:1370 (+) Transcript_64:91-4200(+)